MDFLQIAAKVGWNFQVSVAFTKSLIYASLWYGEGLLWICLLVNTSFASLRGYWWKECIIWSLHSVKVTSSCNNNFGLCPLVFMIRSPTVFISPTLWLWITYFFSPLTFHNFMKKLFLLKKCLTVQKNIFLAPFLFLF